MYYRSNNLTVHELSSNEQINLFKNIVVVFLVDGSTNVFIYIHIFQGYLSKHHSCITNVCIDLIAAFEIFAIAVDI